MKLLALTVFTGTFCLLSGCGSDGVVIGSSSGPGVRTTPITHYALPSDDAAGFVDTALITGTPSELGAGNDLWALWFDEGESLDNGSGTNDWEEALTTVLSPGGTWPGQALVQTWTLSIANQHFFRDVDGSALAGTITYEGNSYTSHPVSIVDEGAQATAGFVQDFAAAGSMYLAGEQNEIISGTATIGTGVNGYTQVQGPISNIVNFAYDGGTGSPGGSVLGVCFVESFGQNTHIESNVGLVSSVPNPISGSAAITGTEGGILMKRFVDRWKLVAAGNAAIPVDDGSLFSYYLAAVTAHVIGNGVGLSNSTFSLPIGVVSDQDDIMNRRVILDMSALIAAGKQFQFVSSDHTVLNTTLPGPNR